MMVNEVVYNNGVLVSDAKALATLAVFYDRIWLPHVGTSKVPMIGFMETTPGKWKVRVIHMHNFHFVGRDGKTWSIDRFTNDWNERHSSLFDADVLRRLPPIDIKINEEVSDVFGRDAREIVPNLDLVAEDIPKFRSREVRAEGEVRTHQEIYLWQDHLMHLLRRDQDRPAVFLLSGQKGRREVAKSALAESVLSYCLPQLRELEPEEILEVRRLTADNREGFMAHLQGLSGALDALVKGGAKRHELEDAAADVIQTKLIPDYQEFKRQLGSARVGKMKRILDPASKILEINSSPLTPKFWYDLVRALSFVVTGASENRKEGQTNKSLSFSFIRKLESQQRPELAR